MRRVLPGLLFVFLLLAAHILGAQDRADSLRVTPPPSARDSLHVVPAVPVRDSLRIRPAAGHAFDREDIDWSDYNSIGYIVKNVPGIRLSELGEYGHPGYLSLFGSTPSQFSILRGNESLNDLVTGVPDHNFIPAEEIDSVFVPSAHEAFYYAGNGRQLAVVAHEKEYDSPRPFSRIRHTEGPSDYLSTDVIFSVNPSFRSNFTAGLSRQSLGTTGNSALTAMDARFENSGYESWNLRGAFSARLSESLHMKVEEHYDHFIDMFNGGINPHSASIRNPDDAFGLTPDLVNPTMRGEVVRNRIGARLRAVLFSDSTRPLEFEASFLTGVRYFRDLLDRIDTTYRHLDEKNSWSDFSLSLRKSFSLSPVTIDAGANFDRYAVRTSSFIPLQSGWNTALFSRALFSLPVGSIEAAMRAENTFTRATLGYGATYRVFLGAGFDAWAGASRSERAPTLTEKYLYAGQEDIHNEKLSIAELGMGIRSGGNWIRLGFFLRSSVPSRIYYTTAIGVERPLYYSAETFHAGDAKDWGASAEGSISLWQFSIAGRIGAFRPWQLSFGQPEWDLIRDKWNLTGSGEFFYRGEILQGALDLKTGAKVEFANADFVPGFNPQRNLYGFSADRLSGDGEVAALGGAFASSYTSYARVDLFLFARVRTAIIHLVLENLADARYITTYFYPMPGRSFRFGVSWTFLD